MKRLKLTKTTKIIFYYFLKYTKIKSKKLSHENFCCYKNAPIYLYFIKIVNTSQNLLSFIFHTKASF